MPALSFFYYTRYPVYQATCESDVLCGIDSMLCQFVLADGLMSVGESLHVPCWVYQVLKYTMAPIRPHTMKSKNCRILSISYVLRSGIAPNACHMCVDVSA